MAEEGHSQCIVYPDGGGDAVEPGFLVEIHILGGIENVEACHPEQDRLAKDDRRPGNGAGNGDPGGNRGKHERQAKPDVAQGSVAFGERVGGNKEQDWYAEDQWPKVIVPDPEMAGSDDKAYCGKNREGSHRFNGENACGNMAAFRARVGGIVTSICQPIHGHGQATGQHHAGNDPGDVDEDFKRLGTMGRPPGEHCPGQGKGQRKQRMAETHHPQEGLDLPYPGSRPGGGQGCR